MTTKRFQITHFEQVNEITVSVDLKDIDAEETMTISISPPAFDDLFEEYGYEKIFTWEMEKEDKKDGVIDCVKYAEFDDCVLPE
ncbi:hypothetical protein ACFL9T_01690 [Thermodesulfobacteriota bacterium]